MKHQLRLKALSKPIKPTLVGTVLLSFSMVAWPLDLLQAYEAAKLQDANILATRAATQASEERLPQARAQLLPNVGANLTHTRNNLSSTTPSFLGATKAPGPATSVKARGLRCASRCTARC